MDVSRKCPSYCFWGLWVLCAFGDFPQGGWGGQPGGFTASADLRSPRRWRSSRGTYGLSPRYVVALLCQGLNLDQARTMVNDLLKGKQRPLVETPAVYLSLARAAALLVRVNARFVFLFCKFFPLHRVCFAQRTWWIAFQRLSLIC